jgi:GTP-binding protein Era
LTTSGVAEDPGPTRETRAGFVAVVGAPNAGKSTLVNALVGSKVTIVSPRPQTTRTLVRGIAMYDIPGGVAQVIYVDTPGIHHPRQRFERAMVAAARAGAADADVVMLVRDAADAAKAVERGNDPLDEDSGRIVADLNSAKRRAVLVLNKIDLVRPPVLLEIAARLNAQAAFAETFMVSAANGDGLEAIIHRLAEMMPVSPLLYPPDEVSDMPNRLLAAEVTREKLFLQLRQELPYACAVETESWEERSDSSIRIGQVVYVTRESHRPIVLGEGGRRIKAIGASSRNDLGRMFGRQVHLFLHVKVNERWREDRGLYAAWGLDFDA